MHGNETVIKNPYCVMSQFLLVFISITFFIIVALYILMYHSLAPLQYITILNKIKKSIFILGDI